jgi:hypothetical protein
LEEDEASKAKGQGKYDAPGRPRGCGTSVGQGDEDGNQGGRENYISDPIDAFHFLEKGRFFDVVDLEEWNEEEQG